MMRFVSKVFITAGLLAAVTAGTATGGQEAKRGRSSTPVSARTLDEALKDLTDQVMAISGVVGTAEGLCEGRPCIKVFVVKKTPELLRRIPETVAGYPVAVEETGEFRARDR